MCVLGLPYFFSFFCSETISNIRGGNDLGDKSDAEKCDDTQATSIEQPQESNHGDDIFRNLNDFLLEDDESTNVFRPISMSPTPSVTCSRTTSTQAPSVTPASSMTSRSSKKRRTAASSVGNEYVDAIAEKNVANDEKFLDLLDVMVTSRKANAHEKKTLTATEQVMEGLAKIITTFPIRDQLDMTNRISQIVHERALDIEMRPKAT